MGLQKHPLAVKQYNNADRPFLDKPSERFSFRQVQGPLVGLSNRGNRGFPTDRMSQRCPPLYLAPYRGLKVYRIGEQTDVKSTNSGKVYGYGTTYNKIMKRILCLFCFFLIGIHMYGKRKNIMYYVEIPEYMVAQLDSVYYSCTNEFHVGAGINVHNLVNYKDTSFKDGIYVFRGMGPHFQQLMFIRYKHKLYFFNAHNAINVQKQLMDAKEKLLIESSDYVLYLKHIADYIHESYEAEDYYYEAIDESYHDGILLPLGN